MRAALAPERAAMEACGALTGRGVGGVLDLFEAATVDATYKLSRSIDNTRKVSLLPPPPSPPPLIPQVAEKISNFDLPLAAALTFAISPIDLAAPPQLAHFLRFASDFASTGRSRLDVNVPSRPPRDTLELRVRGSIPTCSPLCSMRPSNNFYIFIYLFIYFLFVN